jgi:hypothetical protein
LYRALFIAKYRHFKKKISTTIYTSNKELDDGPTGNVAPNFELHDFQLKKKESLSKFQLEPKKRETSSQNYKLSYQRQEYQSRLENIREITSTLNKGRNTNFFH